MGSSGGGGGKSGRGGGGNAAPGEKRTKDEGSYKTKGSMARPKGVPEGAIYSGTRGWYVPKL